MIIGSSTSHRVAQPLMILELFLKVNQDDEGHLHSGKSIQRVVVELDKDQMREFVGRLSKIEKEVVGLSQH